MIGLRAENDQSSKSFFSATANRKTYRFAEQYSGRFFVSGVSGSFAKYTKQLKETDKKYLKQEKPEKKYTHEPLLEKHQKEELRRDAQRLLEMEEQLAQLQRMRELKRQRDRARRKKKLEYTSACCIQRAYRRHAQYRRDKSADILVSFLRTLAAQHALSAASWASSVIKKFAIKSSYCWKERKFVQRIAHRLAEDSWGVVQEVACVYTVARRRVTDELLFNAITTGTKRAVQAILDSGSIFRPKKVRRKSARAHDRDRDKGGNAQFFLTEFDSPGGGGHGSNDSDGGNSDGFGDDDDDFTDYGDDRPGQTRKSMRFFNKERNSLEDLTASALAALRLSKRQRPAKTYDPNNAEHKRIIELHRKRLNDFAAERARRMAQVTERKEQEERAALERQQSEERLKQTAELHKKEYQEKLAQEDRARARMMAKVRADREAARIKREAAEKQQAQERSAMQQHDKPCYQASAVSSAKAVAKSAQRKSAGRPVSAVRPGSASVAADADWTVVLDPAAAKAAKPAPEVSKPAPAPRPKPAPVVDAVAADHEYYQKSLPPRRPGVPRLATAVDGAVSLAKQKKAEEQAAIEAEALIQLEIRHAKFTSEEAVRRSRLAVQRRVAAKLARQAEKEKEKEDSEVGKKEKMRQIAEIAALKLKSDLEKKKKREADRRRELGIDTPPDPYAVSVTNGGAALRRRKHKRAHKTVPGESDASASESEKLAAASKPAKAVDPSTEAQKGAAGRYAAAAESEEEGRDGTSESSSEFADDDEDGNEGGYFQQEREAEAGDSDDSDSLDAMMSGLTRALRQQSSGPPAAPRKTLGDSPPDALMSGQTVSTRSSSAGANDTLPRNPQRNTASGGTVSRKLLNSTLYTPSPVPAGRNALYSGDSNDSGRRQDTAFERADISSAHEHFDDLMEDFGAEAFLRKPSVVQLFRTNTSGELVEALGETEPAKATERSTRAGRQGKVSKPKVQTGPTTKKLVIPKHLQDTPYFQHYVKHADLSESKSAAVLGGAEGGAPAAEPSVKASGKAVSKVPLLAHKKQKQMLEGAAAAGQGMDASASAPLLGLDEDLLSFQAKQSMKPGKVASLLEMVTKARSKLAKHSGGGGGGAQSGTDASDTDTDAARPPVRKLDAVDEAGGAPAPAPMQSAAGRLTPVGSETPTGTSVKFAPATDAQLDAMVPSLQPPSIPQQLPIPAISFSRKMQANIPLPPLSKDNLTILLKGRNPDSFPAQAAPVSVKAPSKKVSKKSAPKEEQSGATAAAPQSSRKAAVPKAASSKAKPTALGSSAALRKTGGVANRRYAGAAGDDDEDEDGAEEWGAGASDAEQWEDPQTESPDAPPAKGKRGRKGEIMLISELDELDEAAEEEGHEDDEEEQDEEQDEEGLEQEYSRLRQEFNAKLQQAAAYNQVRNSTKSLGEDAGAGSAQGRELDEDQEDGGYGAAVEASGSVTQSYSEGQAKISTEELLRMWEMEDAAEEELRSAQGQRGAVATSGSNQLSPGNDDGGPVLGAGARRVSAGVAARQDKEQSDWDSEEEEESAMGYGRRGRAAQAEAPAAAKPTRSLEGSRIRSGAGATPAAVVVPIPAAPVSVDDPALDEDCLSFLNKMSMKIPPK